MGYIRHRAIVVTGTYDGWAGRAHAKAEELAREHGIGGYAERLVSPLLGPSVNDTESFFVAPDGSKEGWEMSDEGDAFRDAFVDWLEGQRYEDGSSPLAWVEVQYGDDNQDTRVIRHSDEILPE